MPGSYCRPTQVVRGGDAGNFQSGQADGQRPSRPFRSRSIGVAEDQSVELRWAGRADCRHASPPCRGTEMGQRETVFPRAEFLHAASRSGGAAAHHLSWLVTAPGKGWRGCRRAVCPARGDHCSCAQHSLCQLSADVGDDLHILWCQGGRSGDCGDGALAACRQDTEARPVGSDNSDILSCQLCIRCSLSACHSWRGCDRTCMASAY